MNQDTTEIKNTAEAGQLERLVMPKAVGFVTYDVRVECPNCGKNLCLNQHPYNDYKTEYSKAEDDLGVALFGGVDNPAKWDSLEIEYQCCKCRKHFLLTEIQI